MDSLAALGVEVNQSIAPFTSFKIGGTAQYFATVQSKTHLKQLLRFAGQRGLRVWVLGGGTNLLVDDGTQLEGLVLRMATCSNPINPRLKKTQIVCGAGERLSRLVRNSIEHGLSGLEDFAGIPGTVGGAVFCNSGGMKRAIGEKVEWIEGFTKEGQQVVLNRRELEFCYRSSNLRGRCAYNDLLEAGEYDQSPST